MMADENCPHILISNAVKILGIDSGPDYYCYLKYETFRDEEGDYREYDFCNHDNHFVCPRYLNHKEKKEREKRERLEREREEIISRMGFGD